MDAGTEHNNNIQKEILETMEKLKDLKRAAEKETAADKYHEKELQGYSRGIERAINLLNATNLVKDIKTSKDMPKEEHIKELFGELKAAEEKTSKAEKEWEKAPESKEKEKEFDKAYNAEFAAFEKLATGIEKITGGKIDKKTARTMIRENRNELEKIITKNMPQDARQDKKAKRRKGKSR